MENNKIDDGGSAFPHQELIQRILGGDGRMCDRVYHAQSGMSLRDYFAVAALSIAQANWQKHNDENSEGEDPAKSLVAEEAYEYADAMLAARKEDA